MQGEADKKGKVQGTQFPGGGQSNPGNPCDCSACLFAQGCVVFGSTYLQYAFALTPCTKNLRRLVAPIPVIFPGQSP